MTHPRSSWFRHRLRRYDLGRFETALIAVTIVWMTVTVWGSLQ
jgi:hypothetical protein